jgi:iron(III) transport system substrate-binding protein
MRGSRGATLMLALAACLVPLTFGGSAARAQPEDVPSGIVDGELVGSPALVRAACAEGRVQIYSIQGSEDERSVTSAFRRAFPCITVAVVSAVGPRLYERVLGEAQGGKVQADVLLMSDVSLVRALIAKHLVRGYTPPSAARYPASTKQSGWWYTAALSMMYIIYNPDAAGAGPATWLDLLDPKWKGLIATSPPNIGGTAWSLMAFLKMRYGDQYLKRLAAQEPRLYTSYQGVAQEVARGEFPVGIIGGLAEYPLRVAGDAPIRAVFPKDGIPYTVYPLALTSAAPHPHAAELLANWYLSKAGQTREVEVRGAFSARIDVPPAKGNPPLASLHPWTPSDALIARTHDALIAEFADLFGTR